MSHVLPSRMSSHREQKLRAIRRAIDAHREQGDGCTCGARRPPYLMAVSGGWYGPHLAEQIVKVV